jgi:hypothetical protein
MKIAIGYCNPFFEEIRMLDKGVIVLMVHTLVI